MPKKAADKKFQIQNNLAPVLQCFVINWNRFKQWLKQAKTVISNGDKGKRTHKRTVIMCICVACVAYDDMFSGFNTARKAAWFRPKS